MQPIEIIVIIAGALIVFGVFGKMIYDRITHKPSSECSCCQSKMKRALKSCKKELAREKCSCSK